MNRLTFKDVRSSRIPQVVGTCASDTVTLASYVNEAQERLTFPGQETGWFGTWAKMVFNVNPSNPFITAPREVARLIDIDVCRKPIRINNEFWEFLEFGVGLQRSDCNCSGFNPGNVCNQMQAYDRGMFHTTTDLTFGNKLRLYMLNTADLAKRVFFSGVDVNGNIIYTMDNGFQVNGFYVALGSPFVDSPMTLSALTGIQKDTTLGPVTVYQVDGVGTQSLLATLAPDDQSPMYRRYFIQNLPSQCCDCDSPSGVAQVTAMAKLDLIPVRNDNDFLLIQNMAALKHECQAVRLEEMDEDGAKKQSLYHHGMAIKLLNQQLNHYMGKQRPALQFKPFGYDTLAKAGVGQM